VNVTATAIAPAQLADGEWSWTHTFTVPSGCTIVEPPATDDTPGTTVGPPQTTTHPTTPIVVEAGLAGDGAAPGSDQDLVLVLSGLSLIAAGGLMLRRTQASPATGERAV
jgi:hypothetical protein